MSVDPAGPTNGGVTVSFGATADLGDLVTGYEGGLVTDPGAEPTDPVASPSAFTPAEGTYYYRVRAVQAIGGPGAVRHVGPDRHRPDRADALRRAQRGARADRLDHGAVAQHPAHLLAGRQLRADPGDHPGRERRAAVHASRTRPATSRRPRASPPSTSTTSSRRPGAPLTPSSQAVVPGEPQFEWTRGTDATSGVAGYEVQIRIIDPNNDAPPITTIARVNAAASVGNYMASRQPAVSPDPLPEGNRIEWRVRTLDVAGNGSNSDWWSLRIDSTIPAAPTITGGPSGPSRDTSPTFTWEGTQVTYKWDVRRAGAETPVREGAGPATQTTLSSLPDGDYIFRVTQVTEAGRGSAEATRTFQVDTTPPEPPGRSSSRPTFPAITAPVFTWATEPGRLLALGGRRRRAERPSSGPPTPP